MQQPLKRAYLRELDIVRAFGIFAVIMIHATSSIVVNYDHSAGAYPMYVFLNIFSKFAVPVFIFLSGWVLFYNYYDKPLKAGMIFDFYRKRLTKIAIPFLIFSFLYYGFTRYMNFGFQDWETFLGYFTTRIFWEKLIIGKTYTHLYFVIIIIQFYLLMPLLLYVVKRFPSVGKHLWWIGLIVQWAFLYGVYSPLGLTNRASYSFTYMLYFMIGASLGIYYPKLVHWINIQRSEVTSKHIAVWSALWLLFAGSSMSVVYIYYGLFMNGKSNVGSKLIELISELHALTASLVVIQLSYWIYARWNAVLVKVLLHIGATSFGIYLLHPIVLYWYRELPVSGNAMLYHLQVAGGFAAALVLPWLLMWVQAWFKWHWVLFGPLPSNKTTISK